MGNNTLTTADESILSSLERIFGFNTFRPGQEEIVNAILAKRDVCAIMPTGGGKSLCYQLPACLLQGTCMVVSPLIALMKDQVDAAHANGIRAAFINSSQTESKRREMQGALQRGDLDLVYVSPERLSADSFLELLKQSPISFAAIDEAHCICAWGHDFRPDYLLLSRITRELPHIPIAAFTASATEAMQRAITEQLGLRNPFRYCGSFNRHNLFYEVEQKTIPDHQILNFVNKYRGEPGIIYRMTRESVEDTAEFLCGEGINAVPYHAGLSDEVRQKNQEDFSCDRADVVVATIAFGMGIDKSNVRYIVHGDLPQSLEHYYQETGRAGRDGDPAHCLLLFARSDIPRRHYFIDQVEDEDIARQHRIALADMVAFASQHTCRRRTLLAHFGEIFPGDQCGGCDVCTGDHEVIDITLKAQMLLSAVVRTDQRFGANHIINIVWGADTRQIRSFGHNHLKTYGVGKETSKRDWREIFDALMAQQICTVSDGAYPVVQLTTVSQEVLRGKMNVSLVKKRAPTITPSSDEHYHDNRELFDLLRQERRQFAEAQGVPPFVVFSDRTLHDMVRRLPMSIPEMHTVNGVGVQKLDQYGEQFLAVITRFVETHPEAAASVKTHFDSIKQPGNRGVSGGIGLTVKETQRLVEREYSLEQIATSRNLTTGTIASHIEKLYNEGHDIPIDQIVDSEIRKRIEMLFTKHQTTLLKPIVSESEGQFGYEEARLVRAWMKGKREGG